MSFSVSPFSEYSGLISFRIDWFDLLVFKGTLKSSPTPQFKTINPLMLSLLKGPNLRSIPDYWKNHSFHYTDLCWQSNVFAFYYPVYVFIAFLPRNKHRLISWLQSPSAAVLKPKKIKSVTVSVVSPSICHELMGLVIPSSNGDAIILVF